MLPDRLRIGFLMDPIEQILVHHDTTFALMLECARRGHEVISFEARHLYALDGQVSARVRSIAPHKEQGRHFEVLGASDLALAELDALFLRKDPPMNAEYWHATQLVELSGPSPFCINSPAGLRDANEKLFALRFPDLIPRTLVARDVGQLHSFVEQVGQVVLKPIDGFAGRGVLSSRPEDPSLVALLELITNRGAEAIIAQAFVAESRRGDKRIILLNGEPIGALNRVAAPGELRCNMAAGGRPERTSLTERDRQICRRLAPELVARGLYLVGIDILGEYLTEVNVTSPTGVVEVDALESASLERAIIDFAEANTARRR